MSRMKQKIAIVLEFSLIMGMTWMSEFIIFVVGWQFKEQWNHPLNWIFSSINWLTGFIILIAFLLKQGNRKLIKVNTNYFSILLCQIVELKTFFQENFPKIFKRARRADRSAFALEPQPSPGHSHPSSASQQTDRKTSVASIMTVSTEIGGPHEDSVTEENTNRNANL